MDEQIEPQATPAKRSANGMMILLGVIILLVLGGGYFLFANKSTQRPSSTTIMPTTEPTKTESMQPSSASNAAGTTTTVSPSAAMAANEKAFTVEGGAFYFKPNQITVKKGDTVKITFNNAGGFHDFVIDEYNVKTARLNSGQSATVTFVADKAGTFEYYCSVGNHRSMGMKGTLVVQ